MRPFLGSVVWLAPALACALASASCATTREPATRSDAAARLRAASFRQWAQRTAADLARQSLPAGARLYAAPVACELTRPFDSVSATLASEADFGTHFRCPAGVTSGVDFARRRLVALSPIDGWFVPSFVRFDGATAVVGTPQAIGCREPATSTRPEPTLLLLDAVDVVVTFPWHCD